MKKTVIVILIISTYTVISCTKGGELTTMSGNTYSINAALDGKKVLPATVNDTTAGTLTGWYDEQANNLSFTLNYKKDTTVFKQDTIMNIRLYKGDPALPGSVITRNIAATVIINARPPANVSGTLTRGIAGISGLSVEEKESFIAGNWYIVMQSKKFPNGVIGGQLTVNKK